MDSAIISIGDELLVGQVVNTNSAWLAEQLNLAGIRVKEIISISDDDKHIREALDRYYGKVDLVLLTGGLGPTKDDITKKTLAGYFGSKLILYPEIIKHIENLFECRGIRISEVNKLQAMLPDNCTILANPSGTAQGMWFEKDKTIFVSMPGVPYEMMDIVKLSLLPRLLPMLGNKSIVHKTIMTQGVPESYLSERLNPWESNLPGNVKLAYLPKPGLVRLRITATGTSTKQLNLILEEETNKALNFISDDVYGFDDITLEKVIGELLVFRKETLSSAESCTGGDIARLITSIPGSSAYFMGSVVSYSNDAKVKILGVSGSNLDTAGAVSREVVEEMAHGARKIFKTTYSIATSGIAGPNGGTPDKPVGTTWIAVASSEKIISKKFLFGEHRGRNIEKASLTALNMLRRLIMNMAQG